MAEKKKKLKKKNNEVNWMVSNRAKLDRRTKQHNQFGVSASNGSRDMARTRSWRKKKKKKRKKKKEEKRKNEHVQSHIASPTGIAKYRVRGPVGTHFSKILKKKKFLITNQMEYRHDNKYHIMKQWLFFHPDYA